MTFHVGQLVVCVDDRPGEAPMVPGIAWEPGVPVRRGNVYEVRWVGDWGDYLLPVIPCVRLIGIARPDADHDDVPLAAERFRPVNDAKLSVFRAMLAPKPKQRKRVDA